MSTNTRGLPVPFLDHMPTVFRQNPDAGTLALAAKSDTMLLQAGAEAAGLLTLTRPEQCPAAILAELGYMIEAGIAAYDSERTRRQKCLYAVKGHKARSQWLGDAKPKIDAITGVLSAIWHPWDTSSAWYLRANDGLDPVSWTDMATMSPNDGTEPDAAMQMIAGDYEWEIPGIIWIDLGSAALSASQIAQLVAMLSADVVPAYFRVMMGSSAAGVFTPYAGGTIG